MVETEASVDTVFRDGKGFGIALATAEFPATAILLNNTAAHHSYGHFGTNAVTSVILSELRKRGINTIAYANNLRGVASLCDHLSIHPNIVVLNGEGTLHDNHERALGLMLAAAHFKQKGTRCVLLNTIWDRNTLMMGRYLESFSYITVRDSLSRTSMSKSTQETIHVVPDLSLLNFGSFEDREHEMAASLGVVDTSDDRDSKTLRLFAETAGLPFYIMDGARRRGDPTVPETVALANTVTDCSAWITGRYHFALAALSARRPFLAVRTRVNKMDGMMNDAGLSEFVLDSAWVAASHEVQCAVVEKKLLLWNECALRRAREYRSQAISRITETFDAIAKIAYT